MRTSAKSIHKAIEAARPNTFKELLKVLGQFRFRNGITWCNVYFMGCHQGVRLQYFDSKNRRVDLPSKTEVYAMKEDNEIAGKIHVDKTGKEIRG